MSPRAAVLVVNFGSHELLEVNLAASVEGTDAHVVVVDNLSTLDERAAARELARAQGWDLLEPDRNTGFGGGMNLGAELALAQGADVLVLLNPDLILHEGGLARLIDLALENPWALVSPKILDPEGNLWASGTIDLRLRDGSMRATRKRPTGALDELVHEWISGACLAVSAEMWRTVGNFDEDYFLYWEDVDLSRRVLLAGGELVEADDVCAVHDEGATHTASGTRMKSGTYYYFNIRNRFLYAKKMLGRRDRVRWALKAPQAARQIILRGGRRQLITSFVPWTTAFRGTWDGFKILSGAARASGLSTKFLK